MNEQYHIIIAGEDGGQKTLPLSRKKLYIISAVTSITLLCLITGCFFTTKHTADNFLMQRKIASLEKQVKKNASEKNMLENKIVAIEKDHKQTITELTTKHDLERTTLQLENVKLMSTAVSELNERSELIETVMNNVGVKITKETPERTGNKGGPFVPVTETSYDQLLDKADNYLQTIRKLPLGKPLAGSITSRYGKRRDPVNGKRGFHSGVDIKGKKGAKIYATASGKVIKALYNGGYGNFVQIDHGNGYITTFAHMQNYVVQEGDTVERGQLIGQVGSTGRSTGPHLHYEISLNDKTINPAKFMKIADLSHTFKSPATEN
jgi:murein DD-endopeptidase MepM/ murein hydrolase activator NlpD